MRSGQNFFNNRNITAIVRLKIPNHLIGKGTVHAWATVSLYGHAPEMQEFVTLGPADDHAPLFSNDPANQEVKETFNKSRCHPDDIALFSGYIADYTQKMTTYAREICRGPGRIRKANGLSTMPEHLALHELGTAAACI